MESENITFEEFLEEVYAEHEKTQLEMQEINVLIKQSQAEVERLAQRNAQSMTYMSQMKLDTAPREDIKEGYDRLLNIQQRLFTMRGQLEKLQSDQKNLQRLIGVQSNLLELTRGMGPLEIEPADAGISLGDQSTVVRVIQTEESARQSLVKKMHDGPASSLSNFILQAEICERLFDSDPSQARSELQTLKSAAAMTFGKVKDFIFDLRPMMLDDLGVIPTLRSYVNSFEEKSGVPVSFNTTGAERRMESHIEVTIFRTVQELLSNARAHGRATQISVQLNMTPDEVEVLVEDNGTGFDVENALNANNRGIGLATLKERTQMLGGTFEIESDHGKGTRVGFAIPIQDEEYVEY